MRTFIQINTSTNIVDGIVSCQEDMIDTDTHRYMESEPIAQPETIINCFFNGTEYIKIPPNPFEMTHAGFWDTKQGQWTFDLEYWKTISLEYIDRISRSAELSVSDAAEYALAKDDALEYLASGNASVYLTTFATYKNLSCTDAANLIVTNANNYSAALQYNRERRHYYKNRVNNAQSIDDTLSLINDFYAENPFNVVPFETNHLMVK